MFLYLVLGVFEVRAHLTVDVFPDVKPLLKFNCAFTLDYYQIFDNKFHNVANFLVLKLEKLMDLTFGAGSGFKLIHESLKVTSTKNPRSASELLHHITFELSSVLMKPANLMTRISKINIS
jgi:hypothetical protein